MNDDIEMTVTLSFKAAVAGHVADPEEAVRDMVADLLRPAYGTWSDWNNRSAIINADSIGITTGELSRF